MFNYAFESMAAQVQSKFGTELDKLWQRVIDYRDTELKNETSYRAKLRKIKDFFSKEIAKRFMDTTYKYTGLWIESVKYVDVMYGSSFCTWMFLGNPNNQDGTFQIENVLDGGYLSRYWNTKVPQKIDTETLIKMASNYDAMKGCIKPEKRAEMKKYVRSEIGFDLALGFLIEDLLPKNAEVKNFTARQITAIMLHEIGHTLTVVEHAGDLFAQTSSFSYLSKAFGEQNAGNVNEVMKLANQVMQILDDRNNKPAANDLKKIVSKVNSDLAVAGSAAKPDTKRQLLAGLIETIMAMVFDVIVVPMGLLVGTQGFKRYGGTAQQKVKVADIPVNERLCTWQERKADEFAFSHGYGADQVDALTILGLFFLRYGRSEAQVEKQKRIEMMGKDISIFEKFRILMYAPLLCGSWSYSLYPAGKKRFKELLQLTIQQLKANGADPEFVAKYMSDIERILDKMEHADKADEFMARALKGYELFLQYASIPSFVDWLVHGRIRKEIEDLINDLQDVGSNLIGYFGHKFQTLAVKDK